MALLAKQAWNLLTIPDTLARVFKEGTFCIRTLFKLAIIFVWVLISLKKHVLEDPTPSTGVRWRIGDK